MTIRRHRSRTPGRVLFACMLAAIVAVPVQAQLDPLLFVKRVPPNIIIVVDTSLRMQEDANGFYYDPNFYRVADDAAIATALGVPLGPATYRRKYVRLQWEGVQDVSTKFTAENILAVPAVWDPSNPATSNAPSDIAFLNPTRLSIAKRGVLQAVQENRGAAYRWGLIRLRQNGAAWRQRPNCDKPVRITANATLETLSDASPCNAGSAGKYGIYVPVVAGPNFANTAGPVAPLVTTGPNAASTMELLLGRQPFDPFALIPASQGASTYDDRPLKFALDDARAEAAAVMSRDAAATRAYRNTIVVLITGGKNSGDPAYMAGNDAPTAALPFTSVSGGGATKRVPVFVVGISPPADDETELRAIAANSGGRYFNVSDAMSVTRVINLAVQAGFARAGDFETGIVSEFSGVSPIVGTVNIKNGKAADGTLLPNTIITSPSNQPIPQRSNVLVTASFSLPGFEARIRAFRVYKPATDSTKPSGWKFENDGTRLWPDLDGRPELAGLARTPADTGLRNIYTAIPNGSGGADVIAVTAANAPTIAPHMALPSGLTATTVISAIRGLPMGAVIGSTPALMDAPSLDPPPDAEYGRPDGGATFAGQRKDRRSLIFFGANDGMIHAVDARTGYEVWAFIPYNLLPKLKTLLDGQPMEQFDYFIDSSPKVAEVKMDMPDGSHQWRSMLIIGQGPGGTFYQAFDVTEAGMGVAPEVDDLAGVNSVLQLFDTPNESIAFKWAFPNYNSFDPTTLTTLAVTDATPGRRVKMYGDLRASSTWVEKTVGFTWSDPAVGPLNQDRTVTAVMTGSGYFPAIEDSLPGRGNAAPRAGRAFYVLDIDTGLPIGNAGGASCAGLGCIDVGDVGGTTLKNALQADPSAAADSGNHIVNRAYLGDLDGRYWRFNFDSTGTITKTQMADTGQPIFNSSALLLLGSANVYMFFSTGSDLLPTSAVQGTGIFKLWALQDNYPAAGATEKFQFALAEVIEFNGLASGERPSTAPSVAGDIVFYTTTTENAGTPGAEFEANLYAFTYLGGAAYDSSTSGNNQLDAREDPRVKRVAGRASAPFIVDQHLYFAASLGAAPGGPGGGGGGGGGINIEVFGDPEDFNNGVGQVGVRVLSWREIR